MSSSQRGSGDGCGAKISPTWVPGVEGEAQGRGTARGAEADLATLRHPCEPGPAHPSPSQLIPVHLISPRRSQQEDSGSRMRCISARWLLLLYSLELWGSSMAPCSSPVPGQAEGRLLLGIREAVGVSHLVIKPQRGQTAS